MATNSLGALTLDLIARTGGFVKGMSKAERESKRWRKQVERDLKKLGGQFANFTKIAVAGGVAAAGAFTIMAKQGLDYVDTQAKMARQIGASIDGLRALQIAGEDAGVATNTLNGAVDRMNARLGEARQGSGAAYDALNRLGLSADALANMDADQRIAAIADRVQELGLDSADTADLLRDLGIRNREMVNLLMQGGDAIREAREEVDEYGLSLSEVDAREVEKANDAMGRIPRVLEPIRNQIAINLAEPMQDVAEHFNEAAKDSGNFAEAVLTAMESAASGVAYLIDKMEDFRKLYLSIREADLVLQVGLESAQNALTPGEQATPAADALADVRERLGRIERGETVLSDVSDFFDEMSSSFRENQERREREQAGIDAGLGDIITNEAIAASEAVAGSLSRVAEAGNGVVESEEDQADQNDETTRAVKALGDSSNAASRALTSISSNWGKGALGSMQGEQDNGASSVRQNLERGKDLSAYWLEPNPTATPTWSTDFAPEGYLENAASLSGGAFNSIAPQKLAAVQATSESLSGHAAAAKDRGKVTIKIADGPEGEVEGDDAFISRLADALSGAAAGSPSR